MSPPTDPKRTTADQPSTAYDRRRFLAIGASLGTVWVAGCAGEADIDPGGENSPTAESTVGGAPNTGTFRLLISDQPVAIGDFDSLDVSFDRARIFRASGDDDAEEDGTETATSTETATPTPSPETTVSATATEDETEAEEADEADDDSDENDDDEQEDEDGGFFTIELEGATVDLTEVLGEKAISVFDGELPAGRYSKIELYAAGVEGIVGGEPVEVKIPSGKLQIVKPFEVVSGETLSFVFDINVVKKGQKDEYNLLPVISESGVAGRDVEVTEVGSDDAPAAGENDTEEEEEAEEGEGGGPPDDAGNGNP